MRLLLIPISAERCMKRDIIIAIDQARDALRRLDKKMDITRERKRFILACEQIQEIALQEINSKTISVAGQEAHNLLHLLFSDENLQIPYVGHTKIKTKTSRLPDKLKILLQPDEGLVAILEPFQDKYIFPAADKEPQSKSLGDQPDYSLCDIKLNEINQDFVLKRTHKQIRHSMETGEPLGWVNFDSGSRMDIGLARHHIITKALKDYVTLNQKPTAPKKVFVPTKVIDKKKLSEREESWWYQLLSFLPFITNSLSPPMTTIQVEETRIVEIPIKPINISIAFRDGSISENFPLFCLPPLSPPNGLPSIRAALISSRHFELDTEVDVCLLRNSEINRRLDVSIAEQERYAFECVKMFIEGYLKLPGIIMLFT